jgi:hypothetical protein
MRARTTLPRAVACLALAAPFACATGADSSGGLVDGNGTADDPTGAGQTDGTGTASAFTSDTSVTTSATGLSSETDSGSSGAATGNSDTSTTTPPEPEQPETGMYSHCLEGPDCATEDGCYSIGNPATDGFCTNSGCSDPATDCDPSPGGTATPTCFMPETETYELCALDCDGKTCPFPMVCSEENAAGGTVRICI